jgi:hypothetical protein
MVLILLFLAELAIKNEVYALILEQELNKIHQLAPPVS